MNGSRILNGVRVRMLGVLLLLLILCTWGLGQAHAGTLHPTRRDSTQSGKTIFLDHHVVVRGLPSPSFSELKKAGFTLVGTQVRAGWGTTEYNSWTEVTTWISSAHKMGLRTFGLIGIEAINVTAMIDVVVKAVSNGVDVIVLDELIARYAFNQTQLESIIVAGLNAKPTLEFIIVEYNPVQIRQAYLWTANYPSARIASDNYSDKTVIDLGANLAAQYGKIHLVWLIFSQGTSNFPSYVNLDSWIQYVKQTGLPTLFWQIDEQGTWQANWSKVAAY
jgi:hypothetical protein